MVRAFIAIDIDEATRHQLVNAQQQLIETGAQLRLVEPQNIHVTIKFLGEVPEDKIPAIADAIRAAVKNIEPFDIHVRGIGVFPSLKYIRVVWAGVAEGRDHVIAIEQNLDRELEPLGFRPERDFVPHLTIARVKTARHKEKLATLIEGMINAEFGVTHARAIELKQSKLTPKGPIYSTLARIELG